MPRRMMRSRGGSANNGELDALQQNHGTARVLWPLALEPVDEAVDVGDSDGER